jgi:tetratricopeptide (TPR) repeat protein
MSIRRVLTLFIMIVGPPCLLLSVGVTKGWIVPKSPWEWVRWILGAAAVWAAFVRAVVEVDRRMSEWVSSRSRKDISQEGFSTPDFPFERVSPRELASILPNLTWAGIPYVSRQLSFDQENLLSTMRKSQRLLILGRTGLGKTREAVELIRRIESEKGEAVTVLIPSGSLNAPLTIPQSLPTRNLILFIDNLPSRYAEHYHVDDSDDPKIIESDFQQRFEQTIRRLSDYCEGYDFRVIATAIGEPELRERLQLGDPFWSAFEVIELPDLSLEKRYDLLATLENHFDIEIAPEAKATLAKRSDGTFSGLIVPIWRDRQKRRISEADTLDYQCVYPQDWEQTVYRRVIEPFPYRKNLFVAMSIAQQSNLIPYEIFIIDLAARLVSQELLFWHRWKLRRTLQQLSDWIELSNGILICPDAYISGKGNLIDVKDTLLASVFNLIKKKDFYFLLRSSLFGLIYVMRNELNELRDTLALNQAIIKLDPNNARAWTSLAITYLQLGSYEDAAAACDKSLSINDHATARLTLASINDARGHVKASIEACRNAVILDPERAYSWMKLGIFLSRVGEFKEAIEAGKKAVELDSSNPFILASLGVSYDRAGQFKKAIEICKRAVNYDPTSAVLWRTLGVAYSKVHLTNLAIDACTKATELDSYNAKSWSLLARTLEDAGRFSEAIIAQERAVNLELGNAKGWLSFGITLDQAGKPEKAINALRRATELDPRLTSAWKAIAITAGTLKQTETALRALRQVTALEPDNAESWYILGFNLSKARLYDAAIEALSKSLELNPRLTKARRVLVGIKRFQYRTITLVEAKKLTETHPEDPTAWCRLGIVSQKSRMYGQAVEALTKAIELDSTLLEAWMNLSITYNRLGQYEAAVAAVRKVAELDPGDATTWYNLAIVYDKAKRYEDKVVALKVATEIDTLFADAWQELYNTCVQLGKAELALDAALKIAELEPTRATAWYRLGSAYIKVGQYKDALTALKKTTELNPKMVAAWRLQSLIAYKQLGQKEFALDALRKAADLTPNDANIWYILGNRYQEVNQVKDAEICFLTVVRFAPDRKYAIDSLKKLQQLGNGQRLGADSYIIKKLIEAGEAFETNDYEKAALLFEYVVEQDPYILGAWQLLFKSYRKLDKHEDLLALAKKFVDLFPTNAYAWCVLGLNYAELQQTKDATEAFRQALRLDPEHQLALRQMSKLLFKLGDYEEALTVLAKEANIKQTVKSAWQAYGLALTQAQRYEEATAAFDHLADLIPNEPTWETKLGYFYLKSLSHEKSQSAFERAISLDPQRVGAIYGLSLCMKHQGQDQLAQELYEQAIAIDSSIIEAQETKLNLKPQIHLNQENVS